MLTKQLNLKQAFGLVCAAMALCGGTLCAQTDQTTHRPETSSDRLAGEGLPATGLFAKTNLVAWCIVPYDAKKRGPEERALMLERLGNLDGLAWLVPQLKGKPPGQRPVPRTWR